ncbi:Protein FAR1-RELATED SEQUENCE [Arachis hypogaea]|nr:Protein FAR1-RELATED SEQUENCE [Arachis hypogaea]
MGWAQLSEFWASPLYMTLTKNEKKLKLCCAMPHACLDEEVMDHFEGSLFLQDEDVRADNDPLAWEDIEGCCVPKNYTKEVQGIDCNLDKFFGDTFYDNWDERLVDGIDELGEGFRDPGSENDSHRRKREPKLETRCGCLAEMRVHAHVERGRWIISYFQDEHNHDMLDDRLTFMLIGPRKMNDAAIDQMNLMLKVGIKTPQIYLSFVHTTGGFQNVPFLKRDMHNQTVKQRRVIRGMLCVV